MLSKDEQNRFKLKERKVLQPKDEDPAIVFNDLMAKVETEHNEIVGDVFKPYYAIKNIRPEYKKQHWYESQLTIEKPQILPQVQNMDLSASPQI